MIGVGEREWMPKRQIKDDTKKKRFRKNEKMGERRRKKDGRENHKSEQCADVVEL